MINLLNAIKIFYDDILNVERSLYVYITFIPLVALSGSRRYFGFLIKGNHGSICIVHFQSETESRRNHCAFERRREMDFKSRSTFR